MRGLTVNGRKKSEEGVKHGKSSGILEDMSHMRESASRAMRTKLKFIKKEELFASITAIQKQYKAMQEIETKIGSAKQISNAIAVQIVKSFTSDEFEAFKNTVIYNLGVSRDVERINEDYYNKSQYALETKIKTFKPTTEAVVVQQKACTQHKLTIDLVKEAKANMDKMLERANALQEKYKDHKNIPQNSIALKSYYEMLDNEDVDYLVRVAKNQTEANFEIEQ